MGLLNEIEEKKDADLIMVQGKVENLRTFPPSEEKDGMYIFDIKGTTYSGFAEVPPFQDGDEVTFKYRQKGQYKNVVYIYNVNQTSTEPTTADKLVFNNKSFESLKKSFSALLCECISLCRARGTFSDAEIEASYSRYLKLCGLYPEWANYTQLNKEGGKK